MIVAIAVREKEERKNYNQSEAYKEEKRGWHGSVESGSFIAHVLFPLKKPDSLAFSFPQDEARSFTDAGSNGITERLHNFSSEN